MRARFIFFIFLCGYAGLGTSHTIDNLPLVKQLPSKKLFRDNQKLVLECKQGQKQAVTLMWIRYGTNRLIQLGNGKLIFQNPSKKNEGKYQCIAESTYGKSTTVVGLQQMYIDKPKVVVKKHKPVEGKMYKLDCKIPNADPKPKIVWLYTSLSDPSDSTTVVNRRITVSPDGDLYFSNVTKEDTSGKFKYVCVAETPASSEDVVLAEHILEDVVPDDGPKDNEVYPQYVSRDFTAVAGSVTVIYCIYGGTPLAEVDWYKDGNNVNNNPKDRVARDNRASGKRLIIKETSLEDQGTYSCSVDNKVSSPKQHSLNLNVGSAPVFTERPYRKLRVRQNGEISVPCQIAGVPVPTVTWTFDTQDVMQNDKVFIEKSTQGNVRVADLNIKNAHWTKGGIYGCKGENIYGEVYSESLVIVEPF